MRNVAINCNDNGRSKHSAFTLLEIVLAMTILALLAGALYSISTAAIESTKEALIEQFTMRRLEGFLHLTRDALLNLPANGSIYLNTDNASNNNGVPDLYFQNATGLFGFASLAGGTLILSPRAANDKTRSFSILRVPKNIQGSELATLYEGDTWVTLLPKIKRPHWSFFKNGTWSDEWPQGAGRPQLVRLEMEVVGMRSMVEAIFYVPALVKNSFSSFMPIRPPNVTNSNSQSDPKFNKAPAPAGLKMPAR
ncbi:MAG: GspJ family type II secretion system protein [Chthoniobacterales bacterium]|nr:GspJ family type II secretion system protein [Chthoniobacterales bacterium]